MTKLCRLVGFFWLAAAITSEAMYCHCTEDYTAWGNKWSQDPITRWKYASQQNLRCDLNNVSGRLLFGQVQILVFSEPEQRWLNKHSPGSREGERQVRKKVTVRRRGCNRWGICEEDAVTFRDLWRKGNYRSGFVKRL